MKRLPILLIAVLVGRATVSVVATEGQATKILLVVTEDSSADLEYMLTMEAGVMKDLLEQAGFDVVAASATGQPFLAGEASLTPDARFSDVEVADYAGIIVPCMGTAGERTVSPELVAILREAASLGMPMAAQFGGIDDVAQTGILSGKRISYIDEFVEDNPTFEDAVHAGTHGIVRDGNIVTSGVCPYIARARGMDDGTKALVEALIELIR